MDGFQDLEWVGTMMSAVLTASIALQNATETFVFRIRRSQWTRNGIKIQLMCIFHFLLILMILCLLLANFPGWRFRWWLHKG